METKTCLALWGKCDLTSKSWIAWLNWIEKCDLGEEGLLAYMGVEGAGFSGKALKFDTQDEKRRLCQRLEKSDRIECVSMYLVDNENATISTDYHLCFVRDPNSIAVTATMGSGNSLQQGVERYLREMSKFIESTRAELFVTDVSDEPWFYVSGANQSDDIDGFGCLREW